MPLSLVPLLVAAAAADPVPQDKNVKAGWLALFIILALLGAVALLVTSMNRHLKKARRNAEAGDVFDPSDPPRKGGGRPQLPTSP